MGWQTWLELAPDFDRNGWDEFIDERAGESPHRRRDDPEP